LPVVIENDGVRIRKAWLEHVGRKGRVVDTYGDWGANGWRIGGWKYCAIEDILKEALIDNDMITTSESGFHPNAFKKTESVRPAPPPSPNGPPSKPTPVLPPPKGARPPAPPKPPPRRIVNDDVNPKRNRVR